MTKHAAPEPLLFQPPSGDVTAARLRWLVRLRWVALAGITLAALLAAGGAFPGVAWELVLASAAAGAGWNYLLWRSHRAGSAPTGRRAAVGQALFDITLLTIVLWAAGGVRTPFLGYYVFHIALVGILAGPQATVVAAGASLGAAAFLALAALWPALQIGVWRPVPPWDLLADVAAFVTSIAAVAYIVTHTVRELRDREGALAVARDEVALEYELLRKTLDELEAGLEVVGDGARVLWRNRRAEVLSPATTIGATWACPGSTRRCERETTGVCPIMGALEANEPGRCRFAAVVDGHEKVYEMMCFPLPTEPGQPRRLMNLYVDRTQATIDERKLVLTERLVSLGRVAQGVAHELNTPLATIRTLAADMKKALGAIESSPDPTRAALGRDLAESATLVHDETRRLGRITQALLAGGDLVRAHVDAGVPLAAVVERARAVVFAGVRGGPKLSVDPAIDRLAVVADPDRLTQVLVNLLQNALDAVRDAPGGALSIRASEVGDQTVEIVVADNGPGIAPDIARHLFEPFATTKPPGQGTGLGLYTSYMLVRSMEGTLLLEPAEQGGTRAVVRLPPSRRGASALPAAADTTA